MILVINGTNRKANKTNIFAQYVHNQLDKMGQEVKLLELESLPSSFFHPEAYQGDSQSEEIQSIRREYIIPAKKFIFLLPEYNGSFPGILKYFIDIISVAEIKACFKNKAACLIGVGAGRAGNLRGLEHLTGSLLHLGMYVHPNRLPISSIGSLLENDQIVNQGTKDVVNNLLNSFLDLES